MSTGISRVVQSDLPGRQGRLALVLLVLNRGRPVPRDHLADAIWPSELPVSRDSSLNVILSRLRSTFRSLGDEAPSISSSSGCVTLGLPESVAVDVFDYEEEVAGAEAAMALGDSQACLARARTVIEGLSSPLLPADSAVWLEPHREWLRQRRHAAMVLVTRALLQAREFVAAAAAAEEMILLDPLNEGSWRLLMDAHRGSGNIGLALQAWGRCREVLATELGIDPSEQTNSLYLELLSDNSPPTVSEERWRPQLAADVEEMLRHETRRIGSVDEPAAIREIDASYPSIRAVLARLVEQDPTRALGLVETLGGYWSVRGLWSEGRYWIQQALAALPSVESESAEFAAVTMAEFARAQGDLDEAESGFQRTRSSSDPAVADRATVGLATVWMARGNLDHAAQEYRSLSDDSSQLNRATVGLGVIHAIRGDFDEADRLFTAALDANRQVGDVRNVATCLSNLASVKGNLGHMHEARVLLEEALAVRRHLGDGPGLAMSLTNLGTMLKSAGRPRDAVAHLEEALTIRRATGDRQGLVGTLNSLGDTFSVLGDVQRARLLFDEAHQIARSVGDLDRITLVLLSSANLETLTGNTAVAAEYVLEALDGTETLGARPMDAAALEAAAYIGASRNLAEPASVLLDAAQAIRTQIGAPLQPGDREIVERTLELLGMSETTATADLRQADTPEVDLPGAHMLARRLLSDVREEPA